MAENVYFITDLLTEILSGNGRQVYHKQGRPAKTCYAAQLKSMAIRSSDDPQVTLKQVKAERSGVERWNIAWAVKNLGPHPLRIQSARLPHGKFKADECRFEPAMDLNRGEGAEFQALVRCGGPAGCVTENAFVILYVTWLDESWRIFVRLRVVVNCDGSLETATELITTQKVGFSG